MLPCRKSMINHIHLKMRSFIFIILLSVVCSCSQQNNDDIVVDFNVQNMTYSKIAIVVSPEMIKETNLDKHGKASCTLQGNMIYARLFYGEEAKNVFFQKGDRVTISFDANNFKDGMKFEGKNAPVIEYLNSITYNPIIPPEYERSLEEIVSLVNEKTDRGGQFIESPETGSGKSRICKTGGGTNQVFISDQFGYVSHGTYHVRHNLSPE